MQRPYPLRSNAVICWLETSERDRRMARGLQAVQRLPRIAPAMCRLGGPAAPAHAREAARVGRQRPPGLPFIGGDDVLRLPDFLLEFGNRLLGLAGPACLGGLAHHEPRGLDVPQGLAKLLELGAVPRNG